MNSSAEPFSIIVRDGTKISGEEWLVESPKAAIVVVHGLGEHVGRYHHVASHFNENNLSVYLFDLRGHGHSEGKKGHIPNYQRILDDVEEVLMYARSEYNDLPMFIMGHSLGGNIITNYILSQNVNELTGAIVSSPWLEIKNKPSNTFLKILRILNKIFPRYSQANKLDTNWLSNDKDVVKAYDEDPLVHSRISVRLFLEFLDHGKNAIEKAGQIKLPAYFYHGEEDQITSCQATANFVKKAGDKASFQSLPNTRHEPHNDLNKGQVLSNVQDWIDSLL